MPSAGDRHPGFLVVGTLGAERRQQGAERGDDPLDEIKTDPEQSLVLSNRIVDLPGFLKVNTADLQKWWQCDVSTASSPTEMVYALGLMTVVDLVARKWMDDEKTPDAERSKLWNLARKNCLNPVGSTLSGTAAERRLGHGTLSAQRFGALSLLVAEACKRAPAKILHGPPRL